MKITKRIFAFVLAVLFVVALCGCGNDSSKSGDKANTAATEAPVVTEAPDYSGTYALFGVKSSQLGDAIIGVEGLDSLGIDASMKLVLNADGTGSATSATANGTFKWTLEGENLTMTADEDGSSMTAVLKNGVIEWTLDGSNETMYFAKDGVDTSSYNVKSLTDLANEAVQSGVDDAAQGE